MAISRIYGTIIGIFGPWVKSDVAGFFVLSHLRIMGYVQVKEPLAGARIRRKATN